MTSWELRGYLTYPNLFGQPKAGTPENDSWSRGWSKAQMEVNLETQSDYHKQLSDDARLGRNTYFASYDF